MYIKVFRKILQGIKCDLIFKFLSIGHLEDWKLDTWTIMGLLVITPDFIFFFNSEIRYTVS